MATQTGSKDRGPRMRGADLLAQAARCMESDVPAALVTVVGAQGSTPQRPGARMIVYADGTVNGTIGGGCVEAEMARRARIAIENGRPSLTSYDLTKEQAGEEGLVCGGRMEVFIEPLEPTPDLVILGAGHVARPLCALAATTGFRVSVLDDREKYATEERFPEASRVCVGDFDTAASTLQITPRSFVVVVTRGHRGDAVALASCLSVKPRFLGLMGSRAKMVHVFAELVERGFTSEDLARIETPVGVEIGAETPEEIAVSIVARMISVRRGVQADRIRSMAAPVPGRLGRIGAEVLATD
ncbi:MAG: XdhC family protein [Vicinamibacteria bacterium]|jgi:xanthine dehydrogenase accessory factor|nr:XdhC family protein [Vicinamibacteria bacterium]